MAYAATEEGKAPVGDIPAQLVRHITEARKQKGYWENTQENIFCVNALADYARTYESRAPDMTVQVTLDQESLGETRFSDARDAPVTLSRAFTADDPGREATLSLTRKGNGRLYYAATLSTSPVEVQKDPINAGLEIHREYSVERDEKWLLLKDPVEIRRGELVRVDLFVSLPAARNFVVVSDPVPGGLEPVNRDLATSSTVDADQGEFVPDGGSWWFRYGDWSSYGVSRWSFYHRELQNDSVRFYSEYLPAGNYHLSYTAQAIAPGNFTALPTHGEEMYTPDVFGKGAPGELSVSMEQDEK